MSTRFAQLDGLRGLAAVAVIFHHAPQEPGDTRELGFFTARWQQELDRILATSGAGQTIPARRYVQRGGNTSWRGIY